MIAGQPVAPPPRQTDPAAFASQLQTASASAALTGTTPAPASTSLMSAGASELPADVPYGAEITAAAKKYGIDPALLAGLVKQDSGFNPNAGSPAGARGLTQLMPGTAAGLGVTNVLDPVQSLDGGAKYPRAQARRSTATPRRGSRATRAARSPRSWMRTRAAAAPIRRPPAATSVRGTRAGTSARRTRTAPSAGTTSIAPHAGTWRTAPRVATIPIAPAAEAMRTAAATATNPVAQR